jgi:hypothetical protein
MCRARPWPSWRAAALALRCRLRRRWRLRTPSSPRAAERSGRGCRGATGLRRPKQAWAFVGRSGLCWSASVVSRVSCTVPLPAPSALSSPASRGEGVCLRVCAREMRRAGDAGIRASKKVRRWFGACDAEPRVPAVVCFIGAARRGLSLSWQTKPMACGVRCSPQVRCVFPPLAAGFGADLLHLVGRASRRSCSLSGGRPPWARLACRLPHRRQETGASRSTASLRAGLNRDPTALLRKRWAHSITE